MKRTLKIIEDGMRTATRTAIAFSGGADSLVLLDILYRKTQHRPPILFCSTGMEYPETLAFVEQTAKDYGAELLIARPDRTPHQQWLKQGWPMLGKVPARRWMKNHQGRNFGFRLDCSSCCQKMKIDPSRKFMKANGIELSFTGGRGEADDSLRSLRAKKEGPLYREKASKAWVCNPLHGWTDLMIRRYTRKARLNRHPLKGKGMSNLGCMFWGGRCLFVN